MERATQQNHRLSIERFYTGHTALHPARVLVLVNHTAFPKIALDALSRRLRLKTAHDLP